MRKGFICLKEKFKTYQKEWLVGMLIFLLDQLSKNIVMFRMSLGEVREVLPFFHIHYVRNTGAAFGMMQGGNFILIFIMLGIIVYILKSWKELCTYGPLVRWGSVFILAGAMGNLYDRIVLGYVVDFLDFLIWPVFNVADSFITVGGCLFAVSFLFNRKPVREEK